MKHDATSLDNRWPAFRDKLFSPSSSVLCHFDSWSGGHYIASKRRKHINQCRGIMSQTKSSTLRALSFQPIYPCAYLYCQTCVPYLLLTGLYCSVERVRNHLRLFSILPSLPAVKYSPRRHCYSERTSLFMSDYPFIRKVCEWFIGSLSQFL